MAPPCAVAVREKLSILLLYTAITLSHFYHGDYFAAKPKVVGVLQFDKYSYDQADIDVMLYCYKNIDHEKSL